MKKPLLLFVYILIFLACDSKISANDIVQRTVGHNFMVDGIYYKITSLQDRTIKVTHRGRSGKSYKNEYRGAVVISDSANYKGSVYHIREIGLNAFSDCDNLREIYSKATNAPYINFDYNYFNHNETILYVPVGTKENYIDWKYMICNQIEETDFCD